MRPACDLKVEGLAVRWCDVVDADEIREVGVDSADAITWLKAVVADAVEHVAFVRHSKHDRDELTEVLGRLAVDAYDLRHAL